MLFQWNAQTGRQAQGVNPPVGSGASTELRALGRSKRRKDKIMSMLDDLIRMKTKIDAARPEPQIDIVLSTHCPTFDDKSIRAFYKGKWYLVSHWSTVRKIEAGITRNQPRLSLERTFGLSPFDGVIVIENEELAAEILRYIDEQPGNGFELSEKARCWARDLA